MPGQYTELFDWTDDAVAQLKALWAAGKSASEIMAHLPGVSRAAVCGKIHRLGLKRRENSTAQGTVARIQQKARPERTIPFKPKPVARPAPVPRRKPVDLDDVPQELRDLPADQSPDAVLYLAREGETCRWPLNDVVPITEHKVCGSEAVAGGCYCLRHATLAATYARPRQDMTDAERAKRALTGRKNIATYKARMAST